MISQNHMNKVVTVNLNGRAYQIEEDGYDDLSGYLARASSRLAGNPDRDAIMADFETAIAEKCDSVLAAGKNVVTTREIRSIIAEMGPVAAGEVFAVDATPRAPKKLYLIRDGAWIAGVCNGLAAYFTIDVGIVRIIFVLLGIVTYGAWILVYVVMMLLIPHADTPEQKALARGETFTADGLIVRLEKKYGTLDADYWKNFAKKEESYWKDFAGRWINFTRVGSALFFFLAMVALGLLVIAWFTALYTVATTGLVFGYALVPLAGKAITAVFVSCLFLIVFLPLQSLAEEAEAHAKGRIHKTRIMEKIGRIFVWVVVLYVVFSISYQYYPAVHSAVDAARPFIPVIDFHNKTIGFTS
jgi:phage shock protein PspC (stress-responsive transcriptional regulator)